MTAPSRAPHSLIQPTAEASVPREARSRGASVPRLCAMAVASIGLLVLAGWALQLPMLRTLGPASLAATNPLTATGFIAASVALWLLADDGNPHRWRVARGIAGAVLVAGVVHLMGMLTGHDLAIDTLLFGDAMTRTGDGRSNRMATAAAVNFVVVAVALVQLAGGGRRRDGVAQVLAILVLTFAITSGLGHLYSSGWFVSIGRFTRMAAPSSAAFAVLSVGVLALRRSTGILAVLLSDGPGGSLARGLLPAAFLAPVLLGWLAIRELRMSNSVGTPELVVTLFVLGMIVVFVGLVAWNATQLHQTHLERASAEAALRDSEVRFRLLAENGSDIVSLHDITGRVLYMSPSCERVLGFTPDEVMRMSAFAIVHPDDGHRLRRHFDDLIRGASVTALSCRMLHKTGKHLWLEMMWRAVLDADGRIVTLQAASRDITERKDYERQLEDTRRTLQASHESLVEANARLAALASQDGLTGLRNRRAFEERLNDEMSRTRRTQHPVSLLLLDIDHFKSFNDSYGHPRGDEVLRSVARILARSIRDTDVAARYGGEEFAVILPNSDADGAAQMGERLRHAVESAPWTERGITMSVGVATATSHVVPIESLVEQADRALYRSKQDGRNRVTRADAT